MCKAQEQVYGMYRHFDPLHQSIADVQVILIQAFALQDRCH